MFITLKTDIYVDRIKAACNAAGFKIVSNIVSNDSVAAHLVFESNQEGLLVSVTSENEQCTLWVCSSELELVERSLDLAILHLKLVRLQLVKLQLLRSSVKREQPLPRFPWEENAVEYID